MSFISTIYAECWMHHNLQILTNMSTNIPEDSNPQRGLTLWSSQTCIYLYLISASQDHKSYTLLSHFPGEDMRFTIFNNCGRARTWVSCLFQSPVSEYQRTLNSRWSCRIPGLIPDALNQHLQERDPGNWIFKVQ